MRWRVNSKEYATPLSKKGLLRGYIKYGILGYMAWHYTKALFTPSHHHGHSHGHDSHGHNAHAHDSHGHDSHGHDSHGHDAHGHTKPDHSHDSHSKGDHGKHHWKEIYLKGSGEFKKWSSKLFKRIHTIL